MKSLYCANDCAPSELWQVGPAMGMDASITVLLAEDNYDDALLMQRAFQQHGLMRPPHIVPDGESAIAYLSGAEPFSDRLKHPFPSLLILDLKMPGLNGFDVLEWLNQHPELRVIPTLVWSASADPRDVKHAYCLGANGYLYKPADFPRFKEMVGNVLTFWGDCLRPSVEPTVPTCESLRNTNPFDRVLNPGIHSSD